MTEGDIIVLKCPFRELAARSFHELFEQSLFYAVGNVVGGRDRSLDLRDPVSLGGGNGVSQDISATSVRIARRSGPNRKLDS